MGRKECEMESVMVALGDALFETESNHMCVHVEREDRVTTVDGRLRARTHGVFHKVAGIVVEKGFRY